MHELQSKLMSVGSDEKVVIKPIISEMCFRVFLEYFASQTFVKDDKNLKIAADAFDEVFYEVNQGRAYDFLPFLKPFYMKKLGEMKKLSGKIRHFMEESVVADRFNSWKEGDVVKDYVDSVIEDVKVNQTMHWNKVRERQMNSSKERFLMQHFSH